MKGLLLKDLYMLKSYFRIYMFLCIFMIALSAFSGDSLFLLIYPCIISSMVSVSLIAYEEKEKWNIYAETLPISRTQSVSSKYIISLVMGVSNLILIVIAQSISMVVKSEFSIYAITEIAELIFVATLVPVSVLLPIIYKLGVERGRIFYYIVIGAVCALGVIFFNFNGKIFSDNISELFIALAPIICILLFTISWMLSVQFYKKRSI